jgi:serine/threonine protein kinase
VSVCGHDVLVAGRSTRHHTPPRAPYCWIPSPLDLQYNVFRQTQHIRHFVRGKSPDFLHSSSHSSVYLQVTTRYVDLQPVGMGPSFSSHFISLGFVSLLNAGAFGLVWYALSFLAWSPSDSRSTHTSCSSAKDQLTGASVAIKKIMKPFSTPVLSKRTYRELKLLKHIQHENVSLNVSTPSFPFHQAGCVFLPDHQPQRCLHLSPGGYVRSLPQLSDRATHSINLISYFVTELLGTDLHRLLTSRPLEKQFIQYFLYQILVRLRCQCPSNIPPLSSHSARAQVCALGRCRPSRSRESLNFLSHSLPHIPPSETKQHPRQ